MINKVIEKFYHIKFPSILPIIFILLINLLVVYIFIFDVFSPDITHHVEFIQNMFKTKEIVPNFLYYSVIYLLSGFSENYITLLWISLIVLSCMLSIKFIISYKILINYIGSKQLYINLLSGNYKIPLSLFSFFLLFTFNLPVTSIKQMYLGQFPPNVWHNSTIIFLMPFALLLFWLSYLYLQNGNRRYVKWMFILTVINALIKPSFLFVFTAVFPVFLFLRYRFNRKFIIGSSLALLGLLLIFLQYYLIYQQKNIYPDMQGISIDPFHSWKQYSLNPFMSTIASLLFPLCFIIFYFNKIRNNLLFQYTLGLFIFALIIFILFKENGIRETHLNFIWQVLICNYFMFLTSLCLFFKILKEKNILYFKEKFIMLLFFIHVLMSPVYFLKIFITHIYD